MTFQDQIRTRLEQVKPETPGQWDSDDIKEIYDNKTEIQKNQTSSDEPGRDIGRQDSFEY